MTHFEAQTFEAQCREFAVQFPTPTVTGALALAEQGRVTWQGLYGLFHRSLTAGLAEVATTR